MKMNGELVRQKANVEMTLLSKTTQAVLLLYYSTDRIHRNNTRVSVIYCI